MTSDRTDGAIVASTIKLAHALDLEVVAEGVEDEETWRRLAAAGCQLIQGYALARPAPAADLAPLLTRTDASAPSIGFTRDSLQRVRTAHPV